MDERLDTLTDEALDHHIEALLDVKPSAQFVARTRSRVESQQIERFGWHKALMSPGTAAMAAGAAIVVFVAVAVYVGADFSRPTNVLPSASGHDVPLAVTSHRAGTRLQGAPVRSGASAGASLTRRSPEPEILISPDEVEGMRYLLRGLQARQPAAGPVVDPSAVSSPFEIEPVTIEPLRVAALTTQENLSD